jgi:SH3-like domain-containing protein
MLRILCLLLLFAVISPADAYAADPLEGSGLPVPRFVSLKSGNAYVRAGPSMDYPIKWIYKRAGLPVEIVQEYDAWRKIKDPAGETGWVHKLLLSGQRMAVIESQNPVKVFMERDGARLLALVEPGTQVAVQECDAEFCHIAFTVYEGWTAKKYLWGVYPSEIFN